MKNIVKKQIHSVCRFDKEDFINHNQDISNMMLYVLSSHETDNDNFNIQKSKDFIADLNLDILTKDYLNVRLYILLDEKNSLPISFALFSQDETRDDWHLEFISTNKNYCGMGFAENLFMYAAKDIASTEYPYISSVVNEDNFASLLLHEAIGSKDGIKVQSTKLDNDEELYDEYMDENYDYDCYSTEQKGYSNRLSFLFDVSALKNQDNLDIDDEVIL